MRSNLGRQGHVRDTTEFRQRCLGTRTASPVPEGGVLEDGLRQADALAAGDADRGSTALGQRRRAGGLKRASSLCLGLPLGVLVAGVWVADALAPGQAWLAIAAFAGVSGVIARTGSRVDALLVKQVIEEHRMHRMKSAWFAIAGLAVVLTLAGGTVRAADLPDFTELVEKHAASVVNISTERTGGAAVAAPGRIRRVLPAIFSRAKLAPTKCSTAITGLWFHHQRRRVHSHQQSRRR